MRRLAKERKKKKKGTRSVINCIANWHLSVLVPQSRFLENLFFWRVHLSSLLLQLDNNRFFIFIFLSFSLFSAISFSYFVFKFRLIILFIFLFFIFFSHLSDFFFFVISPFPSFFLFCFVCVFVSPSFFPLFLTSLLLCFLFPFFFLLLFKHSEQVSTLIQFRLLDSPSLFCVWSAVFLSAIFTSTSSLATSFFFNSPFFGSQRVFFFLEFSITRSLRQRCFFFFSFFPLPFFVICLSDTQQSRENIKVTTITQKQTYKKKHQKVIFTDSPTHKQRHTHTYL